ncbi:hypothetical protein [Thermococcus sp. P6]|uniref:hypothetical protein n=1 Tax=Thermococcus sp. P6 TaxID=122420 RepID=UPI0018DF97C3|nr:hypothetical protein [Thermococcus sp. P6]
MKRVLGILFVVMLIGLSLPPGSAKIEPYVYTPAVPETSFSVLALYRTGDYDKVMEGCEWLLQMKTPFDSWGVAYGEEHMAKYTAMAMLALMRGERIAEGRYRETLNGAAYWLIYRQNPDGSWEDYTGTALAVISLREFLEGGYIDESLTGFEKQVKEAINRGEGWLISSKAETDEERIFGYLALGKEKELEDMKVEGELKAYRAFAMAYLGRKVGLSGDFNSTLGIAMALYATGNPEYRKELIEREHFGFWGPLRYRVLDLLSVSKVPGFEDLRGIACPYLKKIQPQEDVERVTLGDYYVLCNLTPGFPSNYSKLLPWQVAEMARLKALIGEDYSGEVSYLLKTSKGGIWRDFYNTEYVVWVLRTLKVDHDYNRSLEYLSRNLTWMVLTKDPKTGNPVYYNVPTYYFAHALMVFKEFGMERELNETLRILGERQYPSGGFPYTQGSVAGLLSTSRTLWALHEAGLEGSSLYSRGVSFLRNLIYANLPEVEVRDGRVELANATFLLIRGSRYVGSSNDTAEIGDLDGYVTIYPRENPLLIEARAVEGFKVSGGKWVGHYVYPAVAIVLAGAALLMVTRRRREKGR